MKKTNIEFLQDIINAESFNKEEALEFLDSIQDEQKELQEELDGANDEVKDLEEKITNLERDLSEAEEQEYGFELKCGIGTIEYNSDNLQLQMIMEALGEQISEYGALKVLQDLQPINA